MNAQSLAAPTERSLAVPDAVDSPQAKLVYLYLSVSPGATVDELHASLDLRRISLLPVLDTLVERGLVDRDGERYVPS
jgi:DNA-binding MarR family transcriptional regulator